MNCPSPGCGTENEDGKEFCAKCGEELQPESESAYVPENASPPLTPAEREKMYYFTKPHTPITLSIGSATHVGKNPGKPNNEDKYLVIQRSYPIHQLEVVVVLLFDGMGSYPGGEKWAAIGLAEATACAEFQLPMYDAQYRWATDENGKAIWYEPLPKWDFLVLLQEALSQENLTSAMQSANARIIKGGLSEGLTFGKFGSTVVAGYMITDLETGRVIPNYFNAGDARISMVKKSCFSQLSTDNTIMGGVSRYLGAKTYTTDPADYNKQLKHVVMGQKFGQELWMAEESTDEVWILFYSDGLGNMLSPETISSHLNDEPQAVCNHLIEQATTIEIPYAKLLGSDKAFAGDDNITVIAVRVSKIPKQEAETRNEVQTTQEKKVDDPESAERGAITSADPDVHQPRGEARSEEQVPPPN